MALHHSTVHHLHIVDIERLIVIDIREHLHIMNRRAHHGGTAAVLLQEVIFFLDELGFLKLHARGMVHHLRLQVAEYATHITLDDLANLGNHGVIVVSRNQPLAGTVTFVDMIVEADLVLAFFDTHFRQRRTTGAHLVDLTEQVQQDMGRAH